MAQLTQLNLEGKPEKQTTQNVEKRDLSTRFSGKQKKAAIVGSVMITTLVGVFFLSTSGCSKKQSEKSAEVSGNQPMLTASTSNLASTTAPPASQPALPKRSAKRSPQRKSHATTYTSRTYNFSLQYPKHYVLKTGDEANLDWPNSEPVQMNFVKPGGVRVAAIELPRGSFSGDPNAAQFASAFFNASVNRNLSAPECAQFGFPDPSTAPVGPVSPTKAKVGSTEFDEVEDAMKQADARYYHLFKNGVCYEFALGVATAASETTASGSPTAEATESESKAGVIGAGVTEANSQAVFSKLEKILSTVKISEPSVPAAQSVVNTPVRAPEASSAVQNSEVQNPEIHKN